MLPKSPRLTIFSGLFKKQSANLYNFTHSCLNYFNIIDVTNIIFYLCAPDNKTSQRNKYQVYRKTCVLVSR